MGDLVSWISQFFGKCLHGNMMSVIGRLSPEGRDQSRALRQWQGVVEAKKRAKAKLDQAYAKMSPEGRAKGKCLNAWAEMARERRRRMAAIKSALKRMSPEGRAMYKGMCAFKAKSPTWTLPTESQIAASGKPAPVRGTKDGFWIVHTSHRTRTSTLGEPFISRGVFRFGFKIVGSAVGLVVGVADATDRYPPHPNEPIAWGLHLSHGALYTKRSSSEKGVLSTKQLVPQVVHNPGANDDGEGANADAASDLGSQITEVEVEVDMDKRRIAFGLSGAPMVKAPVKLSGCVRPWAFMWEQGDAVMLDSRPIQGRSSMVGPLPRTSASARPSSRSHLRVLPLLALPRAHLPWLSRGSPLGLTHSDTQVTNRVWHQSPTKKAPVPLRERALPSRDDLPPPSPNKQPTHAATGEYLPAYAYLGAGPSGDYGPNGAPRTPTVSTPGSTPGKNSSRLPSPSTAIRAAAFSARNAIVAYSPDGRRLRRESSAMSSARANGSPPPSTVQFGYEEPMRASKPPPKPRPASPKPRAATYRPPSKARHSPPTATPVTVDGVLVPTTPGRNSPRSPRHGPAGQHMWDMVRYVSGVYSDTFRQI